MRTKNTRDCAHVYAGSIEFLFFPISSAMAARVFAKI